MDLVIVESPTKAKTLGRFLGSEFKIEATMGHIRDLPEKKIGVVVKDGVTIDYQILPKKDVTVKELSKIAKTAKEIYLATDPDREGEAIAWHTAEILKTGHPRPFKRIVFHEITERAIKEALQHPREIDAKLVDAQQARRVLDRLVGYKLSPLLWRKIRRGLSAGRVQSVAVRLIVEREREIGKFVPEEYWTMTVEVKVVGKEDKFWINLVERDGEKLKITNGVEAQEVKGELEEADYQVADVIKKEARRGPLPPFTTSTLQQTASNKMGWSAKRTMQIAQSLYEQGLITYHRTDSTNLADEAVAQAKQVIEEKFGQTFSLPTPRLYKTKSKVAQEAHEAIRPTSSGAIPGSLTSVNPEESRLYELIWKRFIACQMAEAIVDQTVVKVVASGSKHVYGLDARGEQIRFAGFLAVYEDQQAKAKPSPKKDEEESEPGEKFEEQGLPVLTKEDELEKLQVVDTQKFTLPPPRFNEASLIKALEELGIGRPSTYAPTISTILERRYVEKDAKKLRSTVLGEAVNDFLVDYFPDIVDFQFTAKMEGELDDIANGDLNWEKVIKEFYLPFNEKLSSVAQVAERVAIETEATGEKCPLCKDGDVVIRLGRFGKFLSCSRFPECKYKANYVQKVEGVVCPKDGGEIVVRRTRKGKSFYGCSNWPKCDFASWTKPK